jgi:hypothetical protein
MEGASSFTSISGTGLAGAGIIGLATSLVQGAITGPATVPGILLWLTALILAFSFSTGMTVLKARREGTRLWSASGRKLLYAFSPTMCVGGIITGYCLFTPATIPLPAFWLCLYGAAIMTAGAYSVAPVRLMGAAFILLGIITLFTPAASTLMLGIGFGGFHLLSGFIIWKHHGG